MKTTTIFNLAAVCLISVCSQAQEQKPHPSHDSLLDETSRFIFYSVLEGLYEDGLTNRDVEQILLKKGTSYFHFIYACPICTATVWALEAYRSRPEHLYSLKSGASTFGPGLSDSLHNELYSDNPHQRLIAINAMVKTWLARRIEKMNLSEKEHDVLLNKLEAKRKEGMNVLKSFRHYEHGSKMGVEQAAPAYVDLEECAVCNGAVGKLMKLPHDEITSPNHDPQPTED